MNNKLNYVEHNSNSTLFIVPTPIGNLNDITKRALNVLSNVDLIAAEDTRHTGLLLKYFNIKSPPMISIHNYNEKSKSEQLLIKLQKGLNIALVSNAGTPLINDPGYYLVRRCHELKIRLVPLPGACAAITALIVSGLPTNNFCYEGFLPTKSNARRNMLRSLSTEKRTLIFYESTHRLISTMKDIVDELGENRKIAVIRELTKKWESISNLKKAQDCVLWLTEDHNRCKGEIVLIVEGFKPNENIISKSALKTFLLLNKELNIKKAALLTSKIHGIKKNILYSFGLDKKNT